MTQLSPHLPTSDVGKMVDFYAALGFTLRGEVAVHDGAPVFALLEREQSQLRIELWNLPNWEELRQGFGVTTLWIDVQSIDAVADRLRGNGIPFEGPGREDYGTTEIELFDPEGFRVIFAETSG